MENLVYVKKNTVVCDSLQVAEKFGKNHQHILEAIDKLTVENSTVVEMFHKGTYKADNGHIY
ncbi:MAG: Rha family transcriptional regulator, partial [Lactococcus lactis]